jgi:hypothetical protein
MKPWKTQGDYVLLAGQVPGDASLHGLDPRQEYARLAEQLVTIHRRPVYWRPHPLRPNQISISLPRQDVPLAEALDGAWAVVVISSNLSVDATIAGVPCITLDMRSMAWPVTRHDLLYSLIPWRPSRRQWASDLAYAQWTGEEISQGLAWDHLKRKYD